MPIEIHIHLLRKILLIIIRHLKRIRVIADIPVSKDFLQPLIQFRSLFRGTTHNIRQFAGGISILFLDLCLTLHRLSKFSTNSPTSSSYTPAHVKISLIPSFVSTALFLYITHVVIYCSPLKYRGGSFSIDIKSIFKPIIVICYKELPSKS